MEKQKISLENGKGTNGQKIRKVVIIILSVSFLIILAEVIIYQLLLSRAEEDIYYLTHSGSGVITLYCYDASENKNIEIAEIEGWNIVAGMMDAEQGNLIFERYVSSDKGVDYIELITYDIDTGEAESCFTSDELEKETGLEFSRLFFDRTDKSFVYLMFCKMEGDEKQRFLAKFMLETGEITDLQEVDHSYWIAGNGNVYYTVLLENGYRIMAYDVSSGEESTLVEFDDPYEGFQDITTDGTGILLAEEGKYLGEYFTYHLDTGEKTMVDRLFGFPFRIFSHNQGRFIGESHSCVYVLTERTIVDKAVDVALYIKEPGRISRKIFSFNPFRDGVYITILY